MRTGQAGPGRAGLIFLGPWDERAEILPRKKQGPHLKKSNFFVKLSKIYFSLRKFLKNFGASPPNSHFIKHILNYLFVI